MADMCHGLIVCAGVKHLPAAAFDLVAAELVCAASPASQGLRDTYIARHSDRERILNRQEFKA